MTKTTKNKHNLENKSTMVANISISVTYDINNTYQIQYKSALGFSGSDNDRCLCELLVLQLLSMPLWEPAHKNEQEKYITGNTARLT